MLPLKLDAWHGSQCLYHLYDSNREWSPDAPNSPEQVLGAVHRVKVKKGVYLLTHYSQIRRMLILTLYTPGKAVLGEPVFNDFNGEQFPYLPYSQLH